MSLPFLIVLPLYFGEIQTANHQPRSNEEVKQQRIKNSVELVMVKMVAINVLRKQWCVSNFLLTSARLKKSLL